MDENANSQPGLLVLRLLLRSTIKKYQPLPGALIT